jgi:alpha-beta hydrolase superfamily lysophospholipase
MAAEEKTFTASDGISIFTQTWQPQGKPRAIVCIIHGLGEHSARYEHVAQYYLKHNYLVAAMDLRGHGRSGGQRGHSPSFEIVLEDISQFVHQIEQTYPGLPVFMYGHSLGGLLTINFALRNISQVKGFIVTSPNLAIAQKVAPWKLTLGKVFYSLLPTLSMPSGLDVNNISRDTAIVDKYKADPLVHDQASARFALDFINAGGWALHNPDKLKVPMLLMYGTGDRIVSGEAIRQFTKSNQLVNYREWDGLFHELHNEPEQESVLDYEREWIESHSN